MYGGFTFLNFSVVVCEREQCVSPEVACPKFGGLKLAPNTEFVAAVGMLWKIKIMNKFPNFGQGVRTEAPYSIEEYVQYIHRRADYIVYLIYFYVSLMIASLHACYTTNAKAQKHNDE